MTAAFRIDGAQLSTPMRCETPDCTTPADWELTIISGGWSMTTVTCSLDMLGCIRNLIRRAELGGRG